MFATAWTDLNGNHIYDPAVDSLIAKLVDTDRSNAINAGDTITTNRFPLDFAASTFATATVTTFTVANALVANRRLCQGACNGGIRLFMGKTCTPRRWRVL